MFTLTHDQEGLIRNQVRKQFKHNPVLWNLVERIKALKMLKYDNRNHKGL
jgi:hypothetical protein